MGNDPIEQAAAARRWGVIVHLGLWAVLTGVQLMPLRAFVDAATQDPRDISKAALAGAAVVALQAIKALCAVPRVRDLGRPTDDVVWAMVPVLNVALWVQLLRRAPSEALRLKRIRSWATQISATGAYTRALPLMAGSAGVGLLGVVAGSVALAGGDAWVLRAFLAGADPAVSEGRAQVAGAVVIVLGLYTMVQAFKGARATRGSWWPSLLLLPAVLSWLALTYLDTSRQGAGPALLMAVELAWALGPGAVIGGLVAALWIVGTDRVASGQSASPGDVGTAVRPVLSGTVVAFGVRALIVQLGMQVVIPGIWYAVSFAFSDIVAALRPERPMLRGSSELTRGIRGKVFKLLFAYAAVGLAAQLAVWAVVFTPEQAFAAQFDPTLVSVPVAIAESLGWWLAAWWSTAALVVVFRERDALLLAKQARDAQAAPTLEQVVHGFSG